MIYRSRVAVALLAVAGLASPQAAVAVDTTAGEPVDGSAVEPAEFAPCPEPELAALGIECAETDVPLDHDDPDGESITLALSRLPASGSADERLGTLLVHPGGPGAPGRDTIGTVAQSMPPEIRARYDLVGLDSRGVGASTPALSCDSEHFADSPDPVPASHNAETALLDRAREYATACAESGQDLLFHMGAEAQAHDVDAVRAALGEEGISYLGYGYGGYLGAVYASEYPDRVDRLILDSTIRPDGRWFRHYLTQSASFDRRAGEFFEWMAQHDDAYGLGTDAAAIEAAYYELRDTVEDAPIGGVIGPFELVTTVESIGWERSFWPLMGDALSDVIVDDDPAFMVLVYNYLNAHHDDSIYAPYIAAHCVDGNWPNNWRLLTISGRVMHRIAPFIAWNNTWYIAPCESWPVESDPYSIDVEGLDGALVVHASDDAAMNVRGGYAMHREIRSSRLVVLDGGRDSSVAMLRGETCVDAVVADYLVAGDLPEQRYGFGADVRCEASAPDPEPLPGMSAATESLSDAGEEVPRSFGPGFTSGPR